MIEAFSWRDGERLIRFGAGVLADAPALFAERGFGDYAVLTTERAAAAAPELVGAAAAVTYVPAGLVDEVSAELLSGPSGVWGAPALSGARPQARDNGDRPLVAVGGGRVIDTAKAMAAVAGARCVAIPTTLSGAELTPFHRLPRGVRGVAMVRPALVLADPGLMTSQPLPARTGSALNALAHALEALYTPLANPVCDAAALQAARLMARGLEADDRDALGLGALLAGYASGCTGIAVHHAVCQTLVRIAGTPHAATNAVMLPHSARLMAGRAPAALGRFAGALGDSGCDPEAASGRIARLAADCGYTRLSTLGVGESQVTPVAVEAAAHPAVANTPDPPDVAELAGMVGAAL